MASRQTNFSRLQRSAVWRGCVVRDVQSGNALSCDVSSRQTWSRRLLGLALAWVWSKGSVGNERSWSDLTPAGLRKLGFKQGFKYIRENQRIIVKGCVSGQDFFEFLDGCVAKPRKKTNISHLAVWKHIAYNSRNVRCQLLFRRGIKYCSLIQRTFFTMFLLLPAQFSRIISVEQLSLLNLRSRGLAT